MKNVKKLPKLENYDVLVLPNLYGDIVSDLGGTANTSEYTEEIIKVIKSFKKSI